MARLSFSPIFIRDSFKVFRQRGLKALLLGTVADISSSEMAYVRELESQHTPRKQAGVRKGNLHKIDAIHRGSGTVYLAPDPASPQRTLVVFGTDTKIANGPDLWLYVSDSKDPKKSYGDFLNLGLLKGNKGAQVYQVDQPFTEMDNRHSVIIYCKQFDVLFSFALLR